MRHSNSGRSLSRTSAHRKAMMQNMAVSLLRHEVIKTTLPKAKELRRAAEPLRTAHREQAVAPALMGRLLSLRRHLLR